MVQLKDGIKQHLTGECFAVSIPNGSIKSFPFFETEPNKDYVSIPNGSIKSCPYKHRHFLYAVSIPNGSIKRFYR